jgi:hypothetical protein
MEKIRSQDSTAPSSSIGWATDRRSSWWAADRSAIAPLAKLLARHFTVYGTSSGAALTLEAAASGLAITKLALWEPEKSLVATPL